MALRIHVTTDICLSPQYVWYIVLSKIFILGFQPLPIQKIFLLLCLSLTWANLTLSPGSAFTRNLMNLGTNGQQNNIDCARPNEALEVAEKAPRTSLLMKNKLQYRPGKETHNPEQKGSCFLHQQNSVIMTVFIFLSSFCLNLLALSPPEGVNYFTGIFCASGLHVEYEEEVPKDRPSSKTETKNKK